MSLLNDPAFLDGAAGSVNRAVLTFVGSNPVAQISCSGEIQVIYLDAEGQTITDTYTNLSKRSIQVPTPAGSPVYIIGNVTLLSVASKLSAIDLRSCRSLTTLTLSGQTEITGVNIAGCKQLVYLDLSGCTKLAGIDLTENTALVSLNLANCVALASLSLEENVLLESVDITNCSALPYLDVTMLTVLSSLKYEGTMLQSPNNSLILIAAHYGTDLAAARAAAEEAAASVKKVERLLEQLPDGQAVTATVALHTEEIAKLKESSMTRVELVCEDDTKITLKGSSTALTYAQIKALVDDTTKFVTLQYMGLWWMLPSYDDGGAIMFTATDIQSGHPQVTRVIINSAGQLNNYTIVAEDADHKTNDLSVEVAADGDLTYPTTRAVNGKFTEVDEKIKVLNDEVFGTEHEIIIKNEIPVIGWVDGYAVFATGDYIGSLGLSSTSAIARVNVESIAGGTLFYSRRKLTGAALTGIVFYDNDIVSEGETHIHAISGEVALTNQSEQTFFVSEIAVPQNAKTAAITFFLASKDKFEAYTQETEIVVDLSLRKMIKNMQDRSEAKPGCFKSKSASLATDLELDVPNTFKRYNIGFSANISSDFSGKISLMSNHNIYIGRIEIDAINLYYYTSKTSTTAYRTVAHGLTIANFISVRISQEYLFDYRTSVLISSQSGQFLDENPLSYWNMCAGSKFVASMVSGSATNVELTFSIMRKDVWLYGDSYMDYIVRNIKKPDCAPNLVIDGFPGRTSEGGFNSLKKSFEISKPKMLVWALGMNNSDSSTAVNPSWKENVEKVAELCEKEGVELVLVTIPTTTSRNNNLKNEYIRESGYQYVDIANAVGADGTGAWTEGFKDTDDVHPTALGAKAIWAAYVASIPEMN